MTLKEKNDLLEELSSFLDKPYIETTELIRLGIIDSYTGLNALLDRGILPFIQITPRKRVIPRSSLIEFIRDNLVHADESSK